MGLYVNLAKIAVKAHNDILPKSLLGISSNHSKPWPVCSEYGDTDWGHKNQYLTIHNFLDSDGDFDKVVKMSVNVTNNRLGTPLRRTIKPDKQQRFFG